MREQCRLLRQKGRSIGEIAREVGLSESTVHWHVKDIVLSKAQRKRIFQKWCAVMMVVNSKRRGHATKPVCFQKPRWSANLVRLIAHLSFDGRIDRFGCHYYNRMRIQVERVGSLFQKLLGIKPRIRLKSNMMWEMSFYNVELAEWMASKEKALLSIIRESKNQRWHAEWLRAFFDDEGHVYVSNGIRRVRASQKDQRVLVNSQYFLRKFNIHSRIDKQARAVEITGRTNLENFRKEINFSPELRINANRRNGLWKHSIEKRELLALALESFNR